MFASNLLLNSLLWLARISGTLLFLLVAAFGIGEGVPNPLQLSTVELSLSGAFLAMLVGLVLGWKWPGAAGFLTCGGYVFFWIVNFAATGRAWLGWLFALFPLIGLMYLICWRGRKRLTPSSARRRIRSQETNFPA